MHRCIQVKVLRFEREHQYVSSPHKVEKIVFLDSKILNDENLMK